MSSRPAVGTQRSSTRDAERLPCPEQPPRLGAAQGAREPAHAEPAVDDDRDRAERPARIRRRDEVRRLGREHRHTVARSDPRAPQPRGEIRHTLRERGEGERAASADRNGRRVVVLARDECRPERLRRRAGRRRSARRGLARGARSTRRRERRRPPPRRRDARRAGSGAAPPVAGGVGDRRRTRGGRRGRARPRRGGRARRTPPGGRRPRRAARRTDVRASSGCPRRSLRSRAGRRPIGTARGSRRAPTGNAPVACCERAPDEGRGLPAAEVAKQPRAREANRQRHARRRHRDARVAEDDPSHALLVLDGPPECDRPTPVVRGERRPGRRPRTRRGSARDRRPAARSVAGRDPLGEPHRDLVDRDDAVAVAEAAVERAPQERPRRVSVHADDRQRRRSRPRRRGDRARGRRPRAPSRERDPRRSATRPDRYPVARTGPHRTRPEHGSHQMISATLAFRPDPMPMQSTRSPAAISSCTPASVNGIDAGPMLP